MGWGDEYEDKPSQEVKINTGRIISFKSMSTVINKIKDETRDWDDKHPKDDLMAMWTNIMIIYLVLFTVTYSILIVATGIFFFFYFKHWHIFPLLIFIVSYICINSISFLYYPA